MAETTIEWADRTWNPLTGCSKVSQGCTHCYAETLAKRLRAMGQASYQDVIDDRGRWTGRITLVPHKLEEPLRVRKPARWFVNSMSDLFHEQVPDAYIARVFAVMAITAREHTFQVLTKRPERMRVLFGRDAFQDMLEEAMAEWTHNLDFDWPLPNVWLGTSTEDQRTADERIPHLLETPAAIRFISAEPLLGPINLDAYLYESQYDAVARAHGQPTCDHELDWVIAGGESGVGYRALDIDWVRSIRDQCEVAGTAFLFKQVGGRTPKTGGRELDGRTWDEYPIAPTEVMS